MAEVRDKGACAERCRRASKSWRASTRCRRVRTGRSQKSLHLNTHKDQLPYKRSEIYDSASASSGSNSSSPSAGLAAWGPLVRCRRIPYCNSSSRIGGRRASTVQPASMAQWSSDRMSGAVPKYGLRSVHIGNSSASGWISRYGCIREAYRRIDCSLYDAFERITEAGTYGSTAGTWLLFASLIQLATRRVISMLGSKTAAKYLVRAGVESTTSSDKIAVEPTPICHKRRIRSRPPTSVAPCRAIGPQSRTLLSLRLGDALAERTSLSRTVLINLEHGTTRRSFDTWHRGVGRTQTRSAPWFARLCCQRRSVRDEGMD